MSPRVVFGLTLLGVLLAGAPLLHLTGRAASAPVAEPAGLLSESMQERVWLSVRYTGQPESVRVLHAGKEIVSAAGDAEGLWEGEATLPAAKGWELEVEVVWPEAQAGSAQAAGVTATPPGRAELTETQWTYPGETTLHGMFNLFPKEP